MRALIMASVSRPMVMVPARTSFTNCLTRSLPRSRAESSFASRPSSTMLSSSPFSVVVAAACFGTACCGSAIAASFDFGLQLTHFVLVLEGFHEDLVQLIVALQAAPQIRKLGAQLQQLLQRFDLFCDV